MSKRLATWTCYLLGDNPEDDPRGRVALEAVCGKVEVVTSDPNEVVEHAAQKLWASNDCPREMRIRVESDRVGWRPTIFKVVVVRDIRFETTIEESAE